MSRYYAVTLLDNRVDVVIESNVMVHAVYFAAGHRDVSNYGIDVGRIAEVIDTLTGQFVDVGYRGIDGWRGGIAAVGHGYIIGCNAADAIPGTTHAISYSDDSIPEWWDCDVACPGCGGETAEFRAECEDDATSFAESI